MKALILNREFQHPADGWYHIEPLGEHPNKKGGVVQVIDEEAVQSIVNRFNTDAEAGALSHGAEMLIDHEHFKHDSGKETRAFGWLNRLQARADGVYGRVRWSTTGKAAVDGGDYRFFSTEYDPGACAIVNREPDAGRAVKRLRPLALSGLTLTNCPNNTGGKPITNRETLLPGEPAAPASETADIDKNETMKLINTELGLSPEAAESAAVEALRKILNRATTAESELAALKPQIDPLKNRITELLSEQIDADLATAGIVDPAVIAKLKPVLEPMKNRADRVDFLGLMAKPADAKGAAAAKTPLTNRAEAKTPGKKADAGNGPDPVLETKKAHLISNRAATLQREHKGMTQMGAFIQAQQIIESEIASGALVIN